MEYRKLISFGKNSYVISLPKTWVKQNKLKKGDLIYVDDAGSSLLVNSKESEITKVEKEIVILVDGKTMPLIMREIISAYIQNYRTITLKGKEVKANLKELQAAIQNLIALETMEQNTDMIIAKDFLNMDNVSVDELIRKMDIVTRTMLKDMCRIFVEDQYESMNQMDKDVNRLYFLLYRAVLYNLENPRLALKNLKMSPTDLFQMHSAGFFIEGIADEARRTARYVRSVTLPVAGKKVVEQLLVRLNQYYIDTMKSVHNKDLAGSLALSDLKASFNAEIDPLEEKYRAVENMGAVVARLRRMVSHIHNLGRLMYTISTIQE